MVKFSQLYFEYVEMPYWALKRKRVNKRLLARGLPASFAGVPLRWYESTTLSMPNARRTNYDPRRVACYFHEQGSVWLELSGSSPWDEAAHWWTFMRMGAEVCGVEAPVEALAAYWDSQGHDVLTASVLAHELCALIEERYNSHTDSKAPKSMAK